MDLYGLILVFLGTVALCMGCYELAKKTVVGRNTSASTPDQIRQFSKIDGICYLVEGGIAVLLAFSSQLPVLSGDAAKLILVVLLVAAVVINFVMARKLLNSFPKEEKTKKG